MISIWSKGMVNTTEALLGSLQADVPVRQVLVGAFWTAVVVDTEPARCGLASTLRPATHRDGSSFHGAGRLLEHSARELAQGLRSPSTLEASIGIAALNALLEVDEAICTEINARELILERGVGRQVAIVGHFPFVEQVRQVAAECWVLELHPRPGDLPADRATEVLPQADVIALTGTSLINHTFDSPDTGQATADDGTRKVTEQDDVPDFLWGIEKGRAFLHERRWCMAVRVLAIHPVPFYNLFVQIAPSTTTPATGAKRAA